jgi:hypothetical protein
VNQTCSFRGSKSRNKVSVGEPAEGSLTHPLFFIKPRRIEGDPAERMSDVFTVSTRRRTSRACASHPRAPRRLELRLCHQNLFANPDCLSGCLIHHGVYSLEPGWTIFYSLPINLLFFCAVLGFALPGLCVCDETSLRSVVSRRRCRAKRSCLAAQVPSGVGAC